MSLESDYFQGSFYAAFESVFRCFKRCFFADKLLFKSRFVFDGKIHVSFLKSVANRFAVISYLAYFFGGVLILLYFDYFCRNIKYIFPVCLLLYFLCKQKEGICYIIEPIAFASIIIGIAYFCKPFYFLKKYDNISYGLFLFHFPIIQTLIHFHIDEYNIYLAFALTIVLTIAIATFSWYVIEKRWSILSKAKE